MLLLGCLRLSTFLTFRHQAASPCLCRHQTFPPKQPLCSFVALPSYCYFCCLRSAHWPGTCTCTRGDIGELGIAHRCKDVCSYFCTCSCISSTPGCAARLEMWCFKTATTTSPPAPDTFRHMSSGTCQFLGLATEKQDTCRHYGLQDSGDLVFLLVVVVVPQPAS